MTNFNFGLTMLIVGMGGTMLTLYLLTLVIKWMTKLLPPPAENSDSEE